MASNRALVKISHRFPLACRPSATPESRAFLVHASPRPAPRIPPQIVSLSLSQLSLSQDPGILQFRVCRSNFWFGDGCSPCHLSFIEPADEIPQCGQGMIALVQG